MLNKSIAKKTKTKTPKQEYQASYPGKAHFLKCPIRTEKHEQDSGLISPTSNGYFRRYVETIADLVKGKEKLWVNTLPEKKGSCFR